MDSYRIFQEALSSIRQNKARSALSGFGVAWGIFILTVLLGVGDGFRQGVMGMFDVFAQKSMFIYAGTTSLNYGDKSEGTEIDFTDDDLRRLSSYYSGIEAISPEMYRTGITARNADKDIAVSVCGVRPDYFRVKLLETGGKGRILNSLDSKGGRPVAVIGEGIATALFGKDAIPKSDMEATEKAYLISREQYRTARNQLDIMKHGFSSEAGVSNIVTASTSGTVIDIPVEPGTSVIERNTYNIDTTIAVLAETDRFVFKAKVPEQNLGYMPPGTHAALTFNAYDSLRVDATITKVTAKGEETGTAVRFTVEAVFDMTSGMPVIRSGYSATAEILAARKDSVLSLKEKYLTFRNDSSYVYILDTVSGRPLLRTVSTGISDGKQIEITDGISLSDKIITNYDDTDD